MVTRHSLTKLQINYDIIRRCTSPSDQVHLHILYCPHAAFSGGIRSHIQQCYAAVYISLTSNSNGNFAVVSVVFRNTNRDDANMQFKSLYRSGGRSSNQIDDTSIFNEAK
jgi:hypothetical protein